MSSNPILKQADQTSTIHNSQLYGKTSTHYLKSKVENENMKGKFIRVFISRNLKIKDFFKPKSSLLKREEHQLLHIPHYVQRC